MPTTLSPQQHTNLETLLAALIQVKKYTSYNAAAEAIGPDASGSTWTGKRLQGDIIKNEKIKAREACRVLTDKAGIMTSHAVTDGPAFDTMTYLTDATFSPDPFTDPVSGKTVDVYRMDEADQAQHFTTDVTYLKSLIQNTTTP